MKWEIWVDVTIPKLSDVTGQSIHKTDILHWIPTFYTKFYSSAAAKYFIVM